MEIYDLFVTNLDYEPINIDKTLIEFKHEEEQEQESTIEFNQETGEVIEVVDEFGFGGNVDIISDSDMEDLLGKQIGKKPSISF